MAKPILTKEDTQALLDQFQELDNGKNSRVSSISLRLENGTTGLFTRNRDQTWQVHLTGQDSQTDYFGR